MIRAGQKVIFLVMFSALGSGLARAQDSAAIDKIVQLNKKAMEDIDTADFEPAKKALLAAEKEAKRAGLEQHPVMARTYVHLGALYVLGYKDKHKGQSYFGKALDIQPEIKLDKSLNLPVLQEVFGAVQADKGLEVAPSPTSAPAGKKSPPRPRAAEPDEPAEPPPSRRAGRTPAAAEPEREREREPDLPAVPTSFHCTEKNETPPGKKVVLRCVAAEKLGVAKALLYYKGKGMDDYEAEPMKRSPKGVFSGTIPKERVEGTSLPYYFEGLNEADKPVISEGRAESPKVMLIIEKAEDVVRGRIGKDVDPLKEKSGVDPTVLLGRFDRSRLGVDDNYGNRRLWIGVGVGTGGGFAIGADPDSRVRSYAEMSPDVVISGGGWSRIGHLAPELGLQLNPDWAVSLQGRHQLIPQSKTVASYTPNGAHAVIFRIIRYTRQKRFRFYGAAAGGGGEGIRMTVPYPRDPTMMRALTQDTVAFGKVLIGGSGGMIYEFGRRVSWIAEVNLLMGFPNKGINVDFNTALQINLGNTSARIAREEAAKAKKAKEEKDAIEGRGGEDDEGKEDKGGQKVDRESPKSDDEEPK
jgi:hypothetical protein